LAACRTCHQGYQQPLNGLNVIHNWPELAVLEGAPDYTPFMTEEQIQAMEDAAAAEAAAAEAAAAAAEAEAADPVVEPADETGMTLLICQAAEEAGVPLTQACLDLIEAAAE
jgi:photosynthetic reaction center cytochrome c subunit